MVCGDNSGLLGIVPGHHHFWASTTATVVKIDFHSQSYKTPPTRKPSPTSQPVWSPGNGKFMNRQKCFASRHQALEAREYAMNGTTSPLATSPSTPSQILGRPKIDADIHREARAQDPIINEETAVPPIDNNFFYKNGNPKTPSTGRLFIRGLTSKERKRPGGRKKDRWGVRRCGSPAEALKELNPEIDERTNAVDDPIQSLNPTCDRMLLFSFIKNAVGIKSRETHTGL